MDSGPMARLAVLIDAENASHRVIRELLAEAGRYGITTVKRAYGDWTKSELAGWREALRENAIRPIQQFANTTGKNASDSALIIDAMDLLHAQRLDGFCIVSSDSDFTGLAQRVRESGLLVLGFGEKGKTPRAFVAACDRFFYTELLKPDDSRGAPNGATTPEMDAELVSLIRDAIAATSDDSGWSALSAVGSAIYKQRPDFDPRSWGFAKLSSLVNAMPNVVRIDERTRGDSPAKHLFVSDRKQG